MIGIGKLVLLLVVRFMNKIAMRKYIGLEYLFSLSLCFKKYYFNTSVNYLGF